VNTVSHSMQLDSLSFNYVSEHQLPLVIDTSYTTPITRVNRNLML